MDIQLVVCDLDGTLVGENLNLTPRLCDAVRKAQEKGVIVTIATGRGFPSTARFARQLGIEAPLICYQGAQLRLHDGTHLYESSLPRHHLPPIIRFCQAEQWELAAYYQDRIYQTTQTYDQTFYDRWFSLPIRQVKDLMTDLPGDPTKFIITAPTTAQADRLELQVRALAANRFQVMRSHALFVEGLNADVSKANGVARLAQHLGIEQANVMSIGDSENDASMVEWAGIGIAMGNAGVRVKSVADAIAPPQSRDGAAWAIEHYVLGEQDDLPLAGM